MRKSGAFPNLFRGFAAAGRIQGTLPEMVMKAALFLKEKLTETDSCLP